MAKAKNTAFFCKECGYESAKWQGQCPGCRAWNTFVEEKVKVGVKGAVKQPKDAVSPMGILQVTTAEESRVQTGMRELDRVLGGGIVKGSLVLVGGDPGIGKSTILLQMCRNLVHQNVNVLYVSGEESLSQIKMRAERIGVFEKDMLLLCDNDMDNIERVITKSNASVVIIDSIQTMVVEEVGSAPGTVTQVREVTARLMQVAKQYGIAIFIVGHVTKEGNVAGPRTLEHMVDSVLYFEGDRNHGFRILRGVKNRFGSTNEIGVFEMEDFGLREVTNPSEMLLSGRPSNTPGTCVVGVMEGSRTVLAEVQALITPSGYSGARRNANGIDYNRAMLLLAVLEKRAGFSLSSCDAYINVVGGLRLDEPATDLAVILAIASSYKDLPVGSDLAAVGEVGLSGEIRSVSHLNQRLSEIARLGFRRCIIPAHVRDDVQKQNGLETIPVKNIREALKAVFGT